MALDVFYEVIVPLMEMKNAVLIGISTPIDTFSFFHAMLELRYPDTGEYVFNRYAAELICGNCKLLESYAEECRHNLDLIPPWKDQNSLEVVKLIFGNKVSIMKRESMYTPIQPQSERGGLKIAKNGKGVTLTLHPKASLPLLGVFVTFSKKEIFLGE